MISGWTRQVTATIPVGVGPSGVGVNPLTGTVYVADFGSNAVSVISGWTHTVTATIPVAYYPLYTAVTPDGSQVFVTSLSGTVSVISTANETVTVRCTGLPTG